MKNNNEKIASGKSKLFPQNVQEFIIDNAKGISSSDLAILINNNFGTKYTNEQIHSFKSRRKIRSGVDRRFMPGQIPPNKGQKMSKDAYKKAKNTMFKKGHLPHNHRPIGSQRITKDGYIEIKIFEPRTWKAKHIILWEQHNGKVPKGHNVIFIDKNKENIRIENLALVSRAELARLNQSHLISQHPEITKVGITIVKVKNLINKKGFDDGNR